MKITKLAFAAGLFALVATQSHAQTYKSDFSTQVVLATGAGGPGNPGTNTQKTVTLNALAPTGDGGSLTFTLPNSIPGSPAGYFMTVSSTGQLSWASSSSSLLLPNENIFVGNLSGNAQAYAPVANSVLITAGEDGTTPEWGNTLPTAVQGNITSVGTITSGTWEGSPIGNSYLQNSSIGIASDGSLTVPSTIALGDASDNFQLNTGHTNMWSVLQTFNGLDNSGGGSLRTTGGDADINVSGTNPVNIGDTSGAMNINIGNDAGPSVTTLAGTVDFTGTVSLPNGSVQPSSLPLNSNDIFIGNGGTPSVAADAPMTGDVSITYDGTNAITSVNSVQTGAGNSIVSAINSSESTISNSNLTGDGALTVSGTSGLAGGGSVALGGSTSLTIDDGYGNIWTSQQTFNSGITASGSNDLALTSPSSQAIDLNTTNANAVNIGTGTSNQNTIDIGNGTAPLTGTYSTTNLYGAVDIQGSITLPSGAVSPSSLALGSNDIFIGNGGSPSVATDAPVTQDVSFAYSAGNAVATVNSSNASTFAVVNSETIGGSLGFGVTPTSAITNTNDNLIDQWSDGERPASISWEMSSDGYVAAFSNAKVGGTPDNNGLLVKVADNASTDIAFDVASGAPASPAIDLMHVDGAGNVVIDPTNAATTTIGNSGSSTVLNGQNTLASTALSQSGSTDVSAGGDVELSGKSYYQINGGASATSITSIDNSTPAPAGQLIVLANIGTNPITLTHGSNLALNGADVIMGPNGTVTLMFNGTNWILVGSE